MLQAIVACGVSLSNAAHASQSSYDGLQVAGNRDYCAVATQGVSKRNPCWSGWRPAGGRGQCVYACHRALESSLRAYRALNLYCFSGTPSRCGRPGHFLRLRDAAACFCTSFKILVYTLEQLSRSLEMPPTDSNLPASNTYPPVVQAKQPQVRM